MRLRLKNRPKIFILRRKFEVVRLKNANENESNHPFKKMYVKATIPFKHKQKNALFLRSTFVGDKKYNLWVLMYSRTSGCRRSSLIEEVRTIS